MNAITSSDKNSILDSIPALLLMGVLAGAIGGLGVGLVTMNRGVAPSSQSSSTSSQPSK